MQIPPAPTATVTHNLIIADRSEAGMLAVAAISEICPAAEGCISAWSSSADRFFLFILDQKGGRIGSRTATNLEHLLERVLPELYSDLLNPSSNAAFDIFVEEPDVGAIDDRIAQLLINAALEASLSR